MDLFKGVFIIMLGLEVTEKSFFEFTKFYDFICPSVAAKELNIALVKNDHAKATLEARHEHGAPALAFGNWPLFRCCILVQVDCLHSGIETGEEQNTV